jgi:DNA-directed RNA polymerase subunit beta
MKKITYIIAQANTPLNDDGSFVDDQVMARDKEDNIETSVENIDYMDVSPKQVVSVASACIPFLENDDSNRALMGANMQRQAVPLINPHAPLLVLVWNTRLPMTLGLQLLLRSLGTVEYVDARELRVREEDGTL